MAAALYDNAYDNTPGFDEVQYELAVPENPHHQVLYDDKTVPDVPRRNSVVDYSSLQKESEYIETVVDDPHQFVFETSKISMASADFSGWFHCAFAC